MVFIPEVLMAKMVGKITALLLLDLLLYAKFSSSCGKTENVFFRLLYYMFGGCGIPLPTLLVAHLEIEECFLSMNYSIALIKFFNKHLLGFIHENEPQQGNILLEEPANCVFWGLIWGQMDPHSTLYLQIPCAG